MKNVPMLTLSLTAALAAATASAATGENSRLPVPTGHDVRDRAGVCAIGPFGQSSKAGEYNQYCLELTEAERCLALVKLNMNDRSGEMQRRIFDQEKAAYCVDLFRNSLLGN